MTKQEFVAMLKVAEQAGKQARSHSVAGFAARPEFVVQEHEDMADDATPVVKSWVLPELCGFANLVASPVAGKQNAFARLFKKYGRMRYVTDWSGAKVERGIQIGDWHIGKNYYGGFTVTNYAVEGRTQGMVSKERGYRAALEVITKAGFDLRIETRLD